ncbi:tetratricopeptide repeat protein [Ferrimonas pelagia]|uniref:Tetratricopeptide repeat protein n=2 Tax=Ferrimonas pelagia TaxID=1177826 RepID=A0ABP9EN48_9GAMM
MMLALLAGCQNTPDDPIKPDLSQIEQQAATSLQRGHYPTALKHYLELLEYAPDNVDAIYKIGVIQSKLGQDHHAMKAFRDVLKLQPDHIGALAELAVTELSHGDSREAKIHLRSALDLDQQRLNANDPTIKIMLGEENEWHGLDRGSPVKAYLAQGIVHDMKSEYEAGQKIYRLVLEHDPMSADALNNLGYSYYLAGDLAQAEIHLRKVTQRHPNYRRAWTNLGLVYVRMGHTERAFQAFKRVMPEADAYNDIGYFVLLDSRLEEAEALFLKAIDSSPSYFVKAQDNLKRVQALLKRQRLAQGGEPDPIEAQFKAELVGSGYSGLQSLSDTRALQ